MSSYNQVLSERKSIKSLEEEISVLKQKLGKARSENDILKKRVEDLKKANELLTKSNSTLLLNGVKSGWGRR